MLFAMGLGVMVSLLVVFTLLSSYFHWHVHVMLWTFVILSLLFAVIGAAQSNIDMCWVGDLVPRERLGWFTSVKWILGVTGVMVATLPLAKLADHFPNAVELQQFRAVVLYPFFQPVVGRPLPRRRLQRCLHAGHVPPVHHANRGPEPDDQRHQHRHAFFIRTVFGQMGPSAAAHGPGSL